MQKDDPGGKLPIQNNVYFIVTLSNLNPVPHHVPCKKSQPGVLLFCSFLHATLNFLCTINAQRRVHEHVLCCGGDLCTVHLLSFRRKAESKALVKDEDAFFRGGNLKPWKFLCREAWLLRCCWWVTLNLAFRQNSVFSLCVFVHLTCKPVCSFLGAVHQGFCTLPLSESEWNVQMLMHGISSEPEGQQTNPTPPVISLLQHWVIMSRSNSSLFKGLSFSSYLSNMVLKVIFELASGICFSFYRLVEDEAGCTTAITTWGSLACFLKSKFTILLLRNRISLRYVVWHSY